MNTNPAVSLFMALRFVFNLSVYFLLCHMTTIWVVLLCLLWLNLTYTLTPLLEYKMSLETLHIFHSQIKLAFESSKSLVEPCLTIGLGSMYVVSILILCLLIKHWEKGPFIVYSTLSVSILIFLIGIWLALRMIKDINEMSESIKRNNILRARRLLLRHSGTNYRIRTLVLEKDLRTMPVIRISCTPFHFIDNIFVVAYYSTIKCTADF